MHKKVPQTAGNDCRCPCCPTVFYQAHGPLPKAQTHLLQINQAAVRPHSICRAEHQPASQPASQLREERHFSACHPDNLSRQTSFCLEASGGDKQVAPFIITDRLLRAKRPFSSKLDNVFFTHYEVVAVRQLQLMCLKKMPLHFCIPHLPGRCLSHR